MGATEPYKGIQTKKWLDTEGLFQTYYMPNTELSKEYIRRIIDEVQPDYIYINSMFASHFALYPLWLKWRNKISAKIVLAPRGMLKASALRFKNKKKKLFLTLLRQTDIYKKIIFHATDEQEAREIKQHIHPASVIQVVPNLPQARQSEFKSIEKRVGELKVIYLSRIHPIKNLGFLLKALKDVKQQVAFTIIGTMEDEPYWNECQQIIKELPANVQVEYKGEIPHEAIDTELKKYHLFALATTGENFGHAIFEALLAGRPVLISDQTPWQKLDQQKAGWVFPINNTGVYTQQIDHAASMDQPTYDQWAKGAWQLAKNYIETSDIKNQYLKLFA